MTSGEPVALTPSLTVLSWRGAYEEFHFQVGQSSRGETCHCISETLDTKINYVPRLHKCTSIWYVSFSGVVVMSPLIKVTLLKTVLSTISKVHINLHMFLQEPGAEKNPYCVFIDRNNMYSSRRGQTMMNAWRSGQIRSEDGSEKKMHKKWKRKEWGD